MRRHEVLRPAHQESHRQYRQGPNGDRREAVEQLQSGARWSPTLGGRLIRPMDADGVAPAAIQGLHKIVQEKDAKISSLEARIEALETLVKKLVESQAGGEE